MESINVTFKHMFFIAVILIVGFYCHYRVLDNYFYADDGMWLASAKMMKSNFLDVFNLSKGQVRPFAFLGRITYFLLMQLGNWSPTPVYWTILVLRIITSFFLYILVFRYIKNSFIALCVSLIFVVNFTTYETIYWMDSLFYSIGLFFYVLVLMVFLSDIENKSIFKLFFLFWLYLGAILSHENALTLPIVCFAAFLVYNYEIGISLPLQLSKVFYKFFKRYLYLLSLIFPYLVIRLSSYGSQVSSLSTLFNSIVSVAKSLLLWFIPEGKLYQLIFLLNKIFNTNTTPNIQENIFLTVISSFVFIIILGFSIGLFHYFFVKKEKNNAVLMIMGFLILILNVLPAVIGFNYGSAIFPPSRWLYYSSFGFSLVIALIAKYFYSIRIKGMAVFKYIFFICVVTYLLVAIIVNKKIESAFHYDSNIFRIIHRDIKKKISIFPSNSYIFIDMSSAEFRLSHTEFLQQFIITIPELLNTDPPFAKLPFQFQFLRDKTSDYFNKDIINRHPHIQKKAIKKGHPTFYFELVDNKLVMYYWDLNNKDFILKD